MSAYSSTPLAKKLGIKERHRVCFPGSPKGFEAALGPLPEGVVLVDPEESGLDLVIVFVTSRVGLLSCFTDLAGRLNPAGGLWVAWPKKASRVVTDLDDRVVREIGLEAGLVDVKVRAIDEVWSGLKFVIRLVDRPKGVRRTSRT